MLLENLRFGAKSLLSMASIQMFSPSACVQQLKSSLHIMNKVLIKQKKKWGVKKHRIQMCLISISRVPKKGLENKHRANILSDWRFILNKFIIPTTQGTSTCLVSLFYVQLVNFLRKRRHFFLCLNSWKWAKNEKWENLFLIFIICFLKRKWETKKFLFLNQIFVKYTFILPLTGCYS